MIRLYGLAKSRVVHAKLCYFHIRVWVIERTIQSQSILF